MIHNFYSKVDRMPNLEQKFFTTNKKISHAEQDRTCCKGQYIAPDDYTDRAGVALQSRNQKKDSAGFRVQSIR